MTLCALPLSLALTFPVQEPEPLLLRQAVPQEPVAQEQEDSGIVEDVEILRRLIVNRLNEAARPNGNWNPFDVTDLNNPSLQLYEFQTIGLGLNSAAHVTDSNAFYVPGTGAMLTIEASVPMSQVTPKAPVTPTDSDDPWDSIEEEVRGGSEPPAITHAGSPSLEWVFPAFHEVRLTLDPDAVSGLMDGVFEELVRHAERLSLLDQESVTICLQLTGQDPVNSFWNLESADGSVQYLGMLLPDGNIEKERRVVIQINRKSLVDLAKRGASASEAKGLALVHSY